MKLAVDFDTSYGFSGRSNTWQRTSSFLSESDSSHRQPKRSMQLKEICFLNSGLLFQILHRICNPEVWCIC